MKDRVMVASSKTTSLKHSLDESNTEFNPFKPINQAFNRNDKSMNNPCTSLGVVKEIIKSQRNEKIHD